MGTCQYLCKILNANNNSGHLLSGYVLDTVPSTTHVPTLLGFTAILRGTAIIPTLQMRDLRCRKVKSFAQVTQLAGGTAQTLKRYPHCLHVPFNPAILLGI